MPKRNVPTDKAKKLKEKPIASKNPLKNSTIVVTGGSRDIGGGIVLEMANTGALVCSVFRSHTDRAQKVADQVEGKGPKPVLLQADLTTEEGKKSVFRTWKEKFNNNISALILCASGATMAINVDSNMALVDEFLAIRKKQLQKGEKLPQGKIIFLQSEPGHYHRVIDGVFDFLEYYRDKVGPAKRAGEDAFRQRLSLMEQTGVKGIVVCPPEVTDTFNMKLFELQNSQAREKSRELSAKLGTTAFVTIAEVAKKVRELIEQPDVANGHIELFGKGTKDGLTMLSEIYGPEAVYVHTFEKTGPDTGTGRVIVNPKLWMRDTEPSYEGKLLKKDKNTVSIELAVAKEHMRGHFRGDIAHVFPGHKTVRTATLAFGRFLTTDPQKAYLKSYTTVKFRNPILPGQKLKADVSLLSMDKDTVKGNASISVNGKEATDIRGMEVTKIKKNDEESILLLDQLIESAAQTIGMYVMESLPVSDLLPLFQGTGEAKLLKNVHAGDNLLINLSKVRLIQVKTMNIFSADVRIYRGITKIQNTNRAKTLTIAEGELIATINSVTGVLLPKKEVLDKLVAAA